MDKRLVFPAIVMTAWAQQPSAPAVVPKTDAEKALLARAEQFYQLEVDKKFRQAMTMVADDSQDYFFGARPNLLGFHIDRMDIVDETHASIAFTGKVMMLAPGLIGQPFETSGTSTWKIEKGEWVWYVDQTVIDTPFGKLTPAKDSDKSKVDGVAKMLAPENVPTPESLMDQIEIDSTSVTLSDGKAQTVRIANHLPGTVRIEVESTNIEGLTVNMDKKDIAAQQTATISFEAKPGMKPAGRVGIDVQPFGKHFDVDVSSK